jgi:hypothetical protein
MSEKRVPGCTIYITDVPRDLKHHFKAACAKRGKSLKDSFIEHMRAVVREDQSHATTDRSAS